MAHYQSEKDQRCDLRNVPPPPVSVHCLGESSTQKYTRAARKQSQSEQSKSAIPDHAVLNNHVIDWENAKILEKECNASIRKIRESMWIRRIGPQAMNRDKGAHFFSHIFDPFLTGRAPSTAVVRSTGKRKDRPT